MKTYLRVLEAVEACGIRAWLVGDPVREIAMGIQPLSLSVAVEPCDLEALGASLGGTVVGADPFCALHAAIAGARAEISCIRGRTIEEDLARRDFSINAIAIRSDGGFVDPFNGRQDIRNSVIRLSGDDISLVESDPIRIVRMLRFSAELDMKIFWKTDADVRAFIDRNAGQIRNTPPERWGREILNGMRRRPHDFIALCDRYHLLPLFLNEMEELKSIDIGDGQNLFDHTIATLEIGQQFLASRKRRENDMAFSLAMLFHHAGSILSQPTDTKKAADIAARYLRAWNIGSEISGLVSIVVQNYRLPYEAITEERLCELILKEGYEAVEMILDFAICNAQADDMRNMEILAANKWKLGEVARRFEEARRCAEGNPRYLTGDEVMKILDIKSGRVVGEILNELGMAVGLGTISSKKEAKDWVVRRGTGASQ